ncbi:MAG: nuclear transport factor 2 family protein [Actinomycetota bacterium]|nr:nuclear transport factor 2 family protein [Actinomycetota bacterium]
MTDQISAVPTTDSKAIVERFLFAIQNEDFDTADALLTDDARWQNVGLPTIAGRQRIMKLLRSGEGRAGFEVKFHRIAAEGTAVLTERTDVLVFKSLRLQFWVCGVFEVHDGRITLWRDYFDFFDMIKATVRGLAGIAVPALRPSL